MRIPVMLLYIFHRLRNVNLIILAAISVQLLFLSQIVLLLYCIILNDVNKTYIFTESSSLDEFE